MLVCNRMYYQIIIYQIIKCIKGIRHCFLKFKGKRRGTINQQKKNPLYFGSNKIMKKSRSKKMNAIQLFLVLHNLYKREYFYVSTCFFFFQIFDVFIKQETIENRLETLSINSFYSVFS